MVFRVNKTKLVLFTLKTDAKYDMMRNLHELNAFRRKTEIANFVAIRREIIQQTKSAIPNNLGLDKDTMITLADKSNTFVIMPKQQYKEIGERFLLNGINFDTAEDDGMIEFVAELNQSPATGIGNILKCLKFPRGDVRKISTST